MTTRTKRDLERENERLRDQLARHRQAAHLFVHVVLELLPHQQAAGGQLQVADLRLVEGDGLLLQLEGGHATGIERTDDAAGAGAGDHRRRQPVGLEHLDHADVREALGRTAAQRKPHLEGGGGRRRRRRGRGAGRRRAAAGGKRHHPQENQGAGYRAQGAEKGRGDQAHAGQTGRVGDTPECIGRGRPPREPGRRASPAAPGSVERDLLLANQLVPALDFSGDVPSAAD